MSHHCPNCQSTKIIPIANTNNPRPQFPSSIGALIFSLLISLLLLSICLAYFILSKPIHHMLELGTIISVIILLVSSYKFYRQFPIFKKQVLNFLHNQKRWQCRECHHQWEKQPTTKE